MGRSKRKKPFIQEVEITGIAAEGKALARYENKVVFVPYAVPGDIVDLQVVKKRKNYMEARVTNFHKMSEVREKAFCKHFGLCGGCKWQILPYPEQIKHKQQQVEDALTRIGKVELPQIELILASEKTKYYRNKLEFTFSVHRWLTKDEIDVDESDTRALGFHIPGLFDKIVDVEHCYLQDAPSNKIRLELKKFAIENNLSFYDQRKNEGFLRNVVLRTSSTGEVMVIVVFGEGNNANIEKVMSFLHKRFNSEITSLNYVVNEKLNDSFANLEVCFYKGSTCIYEKMENLKFKIGAKSFYQTNSDQAYKLYSIVREFANIQPSEVVYDLYTGTGTIACFLSKNAKKVVGIEYVEEAILDAKENIQINKLNNLSFFAGDMKDVLSVEFVKKNSFPDVVITDPPRAGMHESVVNTIKNVCSPNRIVYVSCNPSTQARDLELLNDAYKVSRCKPIDMFPHTHHVENVVLLEKR